MNDKEDQRYRDAKTLTDMGGWFTALIAVGALLYAITNAAWAALVLATGVAGVIVSFITYLIVS
jgi:fatty acid desaturase